MAQRKTQLVYKPEFLKFGFTEMRERSGNIRPQCLQCLQVLACESMKENKLKRHLQTVHPKFVEKPLSYWKDKEEQIKRSRIDTPSSSFFSLEKASLASFEVAWMIAKSKKPHNIGEELVKPAAMAMVKTLGATDIAKKLESVPLSDNTIKHWKNCLAVCTDGAPSMMGSRVAFVTCIKTENPDVIIIHCLLHQENLASRRLQPDLHAVLSDAIQITCRVEITPWWILAKKIIFKKKLALWREKLAKGKIAAFPELSAMLEDSSDIFLPDIRNIVEDHLRNLQEEMDRYIPENVDLKKHSWIRNAFTVNVTEVGEDIPGFQEELIDLQGNQVQKQRFENLQCSKFWTQLKDKPILTREAEKALLPFPTTYLCEQGFSSLVTIKTKTRNRLDPQHDLRCALAMNIKPRFENLVHKLKQFQGSH
ncbi:zinc finger BED domain-containing protein 5-like [Oratosquilla oratoria]|uniref:zinc finger BED domain-containing protein 5-like n=1 Tax=Oratosquilla oratoria TaxID=337810 RepID=UPI003F75B259